jgi:hypothetical protein
VFKAERPFSSGTFDVITNTSKELLKTIGRRLREATEPSTASPIPADIELHLQALKRAEARARAASVEAWAPAESEDRRCRSTRGEPCTND